MAGDRIAIDFRSSLGAATWLFTDCIESVRNNEKSDAHGQLKVQKDKSVITTKSNNKYIVDDTPEAIMKRIQRVHNLNG